MPTPQLLSDLERDAHNRLRAGIYSSFSSAFLMEPEIADLDTLDEVSAFLERLAGTADRAPLREAASRMRAVVKESRQCKFGLDAVARDFARVFLIGAGAVTPCESVFCSDEGLTMQEQRDETLAFYTRCGLGPRNDCPEPADHVGVQLAFVASLNTADSRLCADDLLRAQLAFISTRLRPWLPLLRARLDKVDPGGWYGSLGALLDEATLADHDCWLPALLDEQTKTASLDCAVR